MSLVPVTNQHPGLGSYSATLAVLRAAHYDWNLARDPSPTAKTTEAMGQWRYTGRGWTSDGHAWLAQTAAQEAAAARRAARPALARATSQPHDRS